MRLRNIKDADVIVNNSFYVVTEPILYKNKWKDVFNNTNDIEVEIGMGKGDFIISKAKMNPNINYIGIEKYNSVLVKAVKKLEGESLSNLRLINFDASKIDDIFDKEISKIYLNFSDPWPKKRHAKRRLTNPLFLKKYENIVKDKLVIEMKSDNEEFFSYSCEVFLEEKFEIIKKSNDYGNDEKNICKTEYEKKFINAGKKINYINVRK